MQTLKNLSLSLLLCTSVLGTRVYAKSNSMSVNYTETPAKTIIIKHPMASNTTAFFSTNTVFMFEIFKPGSKADLTAIIKALSSDANVQACAEGPLTGDYQALTLTLKAAKDKAWFIALFKKAGLNTIKINNNPIVEVDKM
jgi:hypothetical protein